MEAVLIVVALVAMLGAAFFYNPIRRAYAGIIGVGGSYAVLLGIILLIGAIKTLVDFIGGNADAGASTMEIVLTLIVMVLCLGYMVLVILTRCQTAAQRILLPFAACLIGLGFCWRLLGSIVLHIPMESGKSDQPAAKFPAILYDPNEDVFILQSESSDHADYYCQKDGRTVQFWESDLADGLPNGWRRGSGS